MVHKGRIKQLRWLVFVGLIAVASRLVWVQGVKAEEIAARGEELRLAKVDMKPVRGAIVDRNLMHLAVSIPSYQLVANHLQIADKDEGTVAKELSAAVPGLKQDEILKKLQENRTRGFITLGNGINLQQKQAIEGKNLLGINLLLEENRSYPNKSLANQIIGYLADGKGAAGLEAQYDGQLTGKPGYVVAELTQGNTPIESTIKRKQDPVPGRDLVLSLDLSLQRLAEARLDQVVKETEAKRAAVIAMDVHTGEILVMAMRPGADPGDRSTWGNPVNFDLLAPWVATPMPAGSIFKTITSSAALEEQAINLSTTFIDKGELQLKGCRISNWDGYMPPNPAPMVLAQLMQRSSNVGMIQVGQTVDKNAYIKYLRGFGLLEKTGIDLPYEPGPNIGSDFAEKQPCDWAGIYIGQHLEVEPIQMVQAVAAIANGGKLVQPHLVREIREQNKVVWTAPTAPKRTVISAQTAKEVRDVMVSVIRDGTATAAAPKGYIAGGKTGTAQKYVNGLEFDRRIADFIGFAPADNPQVLMMVVVDEPKGQGYGGQIAAPVFADLMPHVMRSLGIPPDSKAAQGTETAPPVATQGVVPSVVWMPTAWAEARLAEAGFVPKVKGAGTLVQTQSKTPGSVAKVGDVVELSVIAANPNDQVIRVPDLSGLSLSEANRLATEIGLTLKASGTGFVVAQEQAIGTAVPARSTLSVRLAPKR